MNELYPVIKPFHSEMFPVSEQHTIYIEQTGNPKGIPVLYLHGGPGAGLSADYRRFFDPDKYWIIGFDQRGCGKSLPFGELENNNSDELVKDIHKIREYLGVKKWLLFGGSWGSTLALLAAIDAPEYVTGLILRGIFLGREEDFDWYLEPSGGAAQLFPDYYQDFLQPVENMLDKLSIVEAYYKLFTTSDEVSKMAAVKAWCLWESKISRLHCQSNEDVLIPDIHRAISLAVLECHYIKHHCFISERYILKNIHKINYIPGTIVHGRYDCVCKIEGAHALYDRWQNGQLTIVPESGHSAREPKITAALCMATAAMATFLREKA